MSHVVRYRVPEEHHTTSVIGHEEVDDKNEAGQPVRVKREIVAHGSVHHREHREFTGFITHSHDDGTHEVALVVPGKPALVHVHTVGFGDGPGTMSPAGEIDPKKRWDDALHKADKAEAAKKA